MIWTIGVSSPGSSSYPSLITARSLRACALNRDREFVWCLEQASGAADGHIQVINVRHASGACAPDRGPERISGSGTASPLSLLSGARSSQMPPLTPLRQGQKKGLVVSPLVAPKKEALICDTDLIVNFAQSCVLDRIGSPCRAFVSALDWAGCEQIWSDEAASRSDVLEHPRASVIPMSTRFDGPAAFEGDYRRIPSLSPGSLSTRFCSQSSRSRPASLCPTHLSAADSLHLHVTGGNRGKPT